MGKTLKSVGDGIGGVAKQVGGIFGIGGGNTPRFDPGRFNYNQNEAAFGPTNADVESSYRGVSDQAKNQVAGIDARDQRTRQTALADALEAQSRGEGPSLAQSQLRQATERNLANQLAIAATARGGNPAATARQVLNNQVQVGQQAAQQSADTRMAEQMNAQQMLGTLATTMRQQDADAQNNSISQQAQILGEIGAIRDANRAALMNLESIRTNQSLGVGNQAVQDTMSRREGRTAGIKAGTDMVSSIFGGGSSGGGGGGGMAGMAAMSDEKTKTDVKDASNKVYDFLEALDAKEYRYKEPDKFGEGERLGVMAQDVEKGGPIGQNMIQETSEGKALDMTKGFGAVLAAQAELHQRLKKIENQEKE